MALNRILGQTARTVALLAFASTGCVPQGVEPLARPVKIDSYCNERVNVREYPRTTSMGSILTSVYDSLPPPAAAPALDRYREGLKSTGGAIAYYEHLRLLKPNLAKALGQNDDYVVAREVIFTNELTGQDRFIYVDLLDHGKYRWQALRVADTQNVCNEGRRLM